MTTGSIPDAGSVRTVRTVTKGSTTEKHSYVYASGKLLRDTVESGGSTKILDFRYDQSGAPYSLTYTVGSTSTVYYYITNLQGDVMYLVDSSGNQVAAYLYDPYGKVLSSSGTMVEINPLRYRGYYQDSETGFYYLQSRHYDPEICRFINADSYCSQPEHIEKMAAGADVFVLHMGLRGKEQDKTMAVTPLAECTEKIRYLAGIARTVKPDALILAHGGPLWSRETLPNL